MLACLQVRTNARPCGRGGGVGPSETHTCMVCRNYTEVVVRYINQSVEYR